MGDKNQQLYLKRYLPQMSGPILEVGSKDYGNTASFRDFYAGSEYVGVDLAAGKNVDCVLDLTTGIGPLPPEHYELLICCSVLEHVRKPWVMADNLTRLIRPNGVIYVSVPWVWRYHAYPDDYFRFSHQGIAELFPEITWKQMHYSTYVEGEFVAITADKPTADNDMAMMIKTEQGKRKYLPYLMVNMLGRRTKTAGRRAA